MNPLIIIDNVDDLYFYFGSGNIHITTQSTRHMTTELIDYYTREDPPIKLIRVKEAYEEI